MRRVFLILAVVAIVEMPNPPKAPACAAAPRRGEFIDVNSEEAIILYDAKTKTEHFIRRANFRTEAKDFGFLVPTPTKPELGETNSSIFVTLHSATAPRQVESGNVRRIVMKRNEPQAAARAGGAPGGPEILGKGQSAGYAYVILRADDVDGLKKWLQDNQYDSRPELIEWLKWYVDNKWIITAFKVLQEPNSRNDRWAKSIRMSFSTDKPFYPYREPEDMRTKAGGQRSLRVFYLGDSRVAGQLGGDGNWPGRTAWANALPEPSLNYMVDILGMPKDAANESQGAEMAPDRVRGQFRAAARHARSVFQQVAGPSDGRAARHLFRPLRIRLRRHGVDAIWRSRSLATVARLRRTRGSRRRNRRGRYTFVAQEAPPATMD